LPDVNTLNGTTRLEDEYFKDDELVKSIKIDRHEETHWRKITPTSKVRV